MAEPEVTTTTADSSTSAAEPPRVVGNAEEDANATTTTPGDKRKLSVDASPAEQQHTNSAKKLKDTKTQPGE